MTNETDLDGADGAHEVENLDDQGMESAHDEQHNVSVDSITA